LLDFIVEFQAVWTIVVMVVFIGIIVWAYSSKRKDSFDKTAQSVLDDDDDTTKGSTKEN